MRGARGHTWHQRLVECGGLRRNSPAKIDLLSVKLAGIEATLKIHRFEKQISAPRVYHNL